MDGGYCFHPCLFVACRKDKLIGRSGYVFVYLLLVEKTSLLVGPVMYLYIYLFIYLCMYLFVRKTLLLD